MRENTRVEKTALFVHRQGPQMEILIKAKQANNPQFGFLNQDHELYKYYRHLLAAIKGGRYKTQTESIQGKLFILLATDVKSKPLSHSVLLFSLCDDLENNF